MNLSYMNRGFGMFGYFLLYDDHSCIFWKRNHSGKAPGGVDLLDGLFLQLGQLPDSGPLDLESEKATVNDGADIRDRSTR